MNQALVIALFGAFGALSRFYVVQMVNAWFGPDFPLGTLAVNVAGSFVIGVVYVLFVEKLAVAPVWRVGFIVGFLGAFTTFSAFSLDTIRLLESSEFLRAGLNVMVNVMLCLCVTWLGIRLAR